MELEKAERKEKGEGGEEWGDGSRRVKGGKRRGDGSVDGERRGTRETEAEKETWSRGEGKEGERGREVAALPCLEPPSSLPPPVSLWNIPRGPPNALGNCLADQGPHLPAENHVSGFA